MSEAKIFPWNTFFEVGVEEIDAQHRELVKLINEICSCVISTKNYEDTINSLFVRLIEYTKYHFESEEQYYERNFLPENMLEKHKGHHAGLISQVLTLRNKRDTDPNKSTNLEEILTTLVLWLSKHILVDDMRMCMITSNIDRGMDLDEAVRKADEDMQGTKGALAKVVGSMMHVSSAHVLELRREITEHKATEVALRESEQALQDRVERLEEAQRRLVRQGADLARFAKDLGFARDQAEAANHAKSDFLAAMSHELRTPLNAIIGFSEIIKNETLGPVGSTKYREYADDINESGQHLLALINDILDLSKVEAGADALLEENIEIWGMVNAVMKLVMGIAQTGNVELEQDMSDDVPVLRADERKVRQILLNLLSNAIKFTAGGGKVTLKIWSRAESGYVFQVIDTGIGISFEDIPKALAHFQQIDSGLNRKHEGTGLGLPLTKSLVEMHGGTLDLQSKVGIGTTVTVRFPAERIVPSPRDTKTIGAAYGNAG